MDRIHQHRRSANGHALIISFSIHCRSNVLATREKLFIDFFIIIISTAARVIILRPSMTAPIIRIRGLWGRGVALQQ